MEVRKTVTVLFADVAGSTAMGERLDPESLRGVMSRFFDEMRSVIERHGGTVEKFIGDAVMAVFGVPTAHEDDALRAVRAASEMREMLDSLNAELDRDWRAHLEIRVGVNTGPVVAADPSGGQFFVTGDAVNVAARLEQTAEPGAILIGEETHRLVRDAVEVEPVDALELKGKSERIPAFRLLRVVPGAASFVRRLDSPIVGREEELAQLQKAFDDAVGHRACRAATILGDAGLGKSRLVNEFVARAGQDARVLWSRCLPYGEGITLLPVVELVNEAAGIIESDSPEEARSKVRDLAGSIEDGSEIADRLSAAIGLGESAGDIQQTYWAVRRVLEVLATERPLVAVFEDIHWAEPTFLDLLQYVVRFSAGHPLFLVCTSRPDIREARPDWGNEMNLLPLDPLSESECEQLIGNLLGQAGLTGTVRERITLAAEGNPLFVEEMLRMLIDEGHLERDDGHWAASGDLSHVSVPGTISALLSARLDQLEAEERAVIQRASVIGKTFWWGAVSDLSPETERNLVSSHLHTLLRKELVRPDTSAFAGEDAFRFSHVLVRDAAYESTPKRARAELHERFASWLARTAGDRAADFGEILGAHLESAYRYRVQLGPPDDGTRALAHEAADRLSEAGRRAFDKADVSAAVNLLSRAVDLLPAEEQARFVLLADLGMVLAQSDIARADAALAEAVDGARATGDRKLEARAGVRRVFVRLLLDPEISQERSIEEVERYLTSFEEWADDLGITEAERVLGIISFWRGNAGVAEERLERALVSASRAGEPRQEAEILRWLALGISEGPTPVHEGMRRLESFLERGRGDRRVEIGVTRSRANLEAMEGRFDAARELIAEAKTLADELGDRVAFSGVLRDSCAVEMLAGDPAAAESEVRLGYEILEEISDFGHLSSFAPDLGDAVYAQGRYDEAFALSEFAESITITGDADASVRWRQLRAKTLARRGQHDEAEAMGREAVRLVATTDSLNLRAHALMSLAEVLRLQDRKPEAVSAVQEAMELYRRKGNIVGETGTASLLAELGA